MPHALDYVRRAFEMPPREAAQAATDLALLRWSAVRQRAVAAFGRDPLADGAFARQFAVARARDETASELFRTDASVLPVQWQGSRRGFDAQRIHAAAAEASDHRFDLLGSGPVCVSYDLEAAGVEGYSYRMSAPSDAAERQRERMNSLLHGAAEEYAPIDWHVDFKSGYRWPREQWHSGIRFGHLPGVDIKVPWELSRFQHAAALGLAYRLDPEGPTGRRAPAEFRAQVVDWIAGNPVGRGVNWACAMDVALRAIGWLTGLALLNDARELTPEFRWLLARSLCAHGRHIEANLEYHRGQTGNHYLSDVVGLLCIGAALPELRESPRWCLFGIQELVSEMGRQVLPDGGDIEGSVTYHHLVAELFLLGTLIALRLPADRRAQLRDVRPGRMRNLLAPRLRRPGTQSFDPVRAEIFPDSYLERLLQMGELAAAVTKPTGLVPQTGDNDNGRAIRLSPALLSPADDPCDRRIVLALAGCLFEQPSLSARAEDFTADAALLVAGAPVRVVSSAATRFRSRPGDAQHRKRGAITRHADDAAALDLYTETGVGVIRVGPLYLAITFGRVPATSSGGHFHNDLLGFELQWDGVDFVVDGGTFIYTPLPELRDRFRSTRAHSTIIVRGCEQRTWPHGEGRLFAVKHDARARVLEASSRTLAVEAAYGSVRHVRRWRWTADSLSIEDHVTAQDTATLLLNLHPAITVSTPLCIDERRYAVSLARAGRRVDLEIDGVAGVCAGEGEYSPGYGLRRANTQLSAEVTGSTTTTRFAFARAGSTADPLRAPLSEESVR